MSKEEFGTKMKDNRKKLGYTLKDLESLLNVSQGHLSKIENGKNKPSEKILYQLNELLKFDDDLMTEKRYELYGINIDNEILSDERLNELIRLITLYRARGNANMDEAMGLLEIIQDIIKN